MTRFDHLLAKSVRRGSVLSERHTLADHTRWVVASAMDLLDCRGADSLRAARLDQELLPTLRRIVLLAAFVHDLGKCSEHFQEMVRGTRSVPQLIRHEAATLWLAWPGALLSDFLTPAAGSRENLILALCAAAGHHRKFTKSALAHVEDGAGGRVRLLCSHPEFASLLHAASKTTGLSFGPLPSLSDVLVVANRRSNPAATLEGWGEQAEEVASAHPVLLALAKALVLAADVAGSALPQNHTSTGWIGHSLANRPDRARLEAVTRARLGLKQLRPFQHRVADSAAPITLVQAGCGTGKTAAAYQWAACQWPGRQLWITYPTTGTATEGFRDYAHNPDLKIDLAARLEHGRADVDLELLGLRDGDEGSRDQDRLDAIRAWGEEVVVCTVDTVLGIIQNQRKGLYAWPGLARSAIVFDEIHAYDDALFGALLRFLESLPGIPALLMTASLPKARLEALASLVERVHAKELPIILGPPALENLPRYYRAGANPWNEIDARAHERLKVLWVSNTVDRAVAVAHDLATRGLEPLVYHSRFRYRDRLERHRDVIDAFSSDTNAFAVTTQVAEMSLDLSADLLITDLAPIPALIQRLGRLNRRSSPENPQKPMPFVILDGQSHLPYSQEELAEAGTWLDALGSGPLSQRDLVREWEQVGRVAVPTVYVTSTWLDGGFRTEPRPLRESDFGITVLLPEDAQAVAERRARALALALPMGPPRSPKDWQQWGRVAGFPVPPVGSIEYDAKRGARWV